MLADIKQCLRAQHMVSLFDLTKRFNVQPDALRDMLDILIRKGQVRKCTKTPQCGTQCQKCSVLFTELYEWVQK